MSKKTIIKGTLILTIAGVATRLLGFYNKIFLAQLIGVRELGLYQLIFPLYLLSYSICSQGISISLTKNISFMLGCHKNAEARQLFKKAFSDCLLFGLLCAAGLNIFARHLSIYVLKCVDCESLIRIFSIAVPFVSVKSCVNALFIGIDKPGYQGFGHFFEQLIRISSTYILSISVFVASKNAILASYALVIGEISAALLSFVLLAVTMKKNHIFSDSASLCLTERKNVNAILKKDSIPLTINNVLLTAFSGLEAIIIPARLFLYYNDGDKSLAVYGTLTGIVIPFLFFPATITNSLSTMLMPAISNASATSNTNIIKSYQYKNILFCCTLGALAWLFYRISGVFICRLAFDNPEAGRLLSGIAFLCPLIFLSGTQSAILNGLNKTYTNLLFNIISISIRILFTMLLVPIYGLKAYVAGMTTGYIILNILLIISIRRQTKSYGVT